MNAFILKKKNLNENKSNFNLNENNLMTYQ